MKRVAVIGAGNVGSHIVSTGIAEDLPVEFLLLDRNEDFEAAQVLDLKDSLLFSPEAKVKGVDFGDGDLEQADIFVITAGVSQKPGHTRCDLLGKNIEILKKIQQSLGAIKSSAIVILVSNPVDILTQVASEIFGLPEGQVFGAGTTLDTSRLRWRLAEKFEKDITDVTGYVMGEHGDSEFVAWSTVEGADKIAPEDKDQIQESVMREAYDIIAGKGSTYFGIGAATVEILKAIVLDEEKILPVSVPLKGAYGIENMALGVPAVISEVGIDHVAEVALTEDEQQKLHACADKLIALRAEVC